MAQQTAVEFYADKQLELHLKLKDNQLSKMDFVVQSRDLLIQSNKMFQQQIMDAFDIRKVDIAFDKKTTSEQYYTQTYGTRLQNETN